MAIKYDVWYNADTGQYETMKSTITDEGIVIGHFQKIASHDHEAAAIGNVNRIKAAPTRLVYSVTLDKEKNGD